MRLFFFALVFFSCSFSYSQARIVFNNDPYMVIDNGAYVVIDNSNANAITQLGTGGRIVSESENDRVKWNIGTATGTYTIPFSTSAAVEIPLNLNITTAGSGTGNVTFSTYPGPTWDNNTYRPSDVTHMHDLATGLLNNSNHVIDRFWIVNPLAYTSKPAGTLDLTYIDAEYLTVGNTIVEGNLGAQRFNSGTNQWGDYLPQGSINTATNVVSAIPVSSANFFRSWTLSESTSPLPIELLDFSSTCNNDEIILDWSTASESQVGKYIISASNDGSDFEDIASTAPMGGPGYQHYEISVKNNFAYYALEISDANGNRSIQSVQTNPCKSGNNSAHAFVQNENVVLNVVLSSEGPVNIALFDAAGQLMHKTVYNAPAGSSTSRIENVNLARGIYFVQVSNTGGQLNQTIKIFK